MHCLSASGTLGQVRISVIVPAFNEARLIGETLSRIKSAMAAFMDRNWETELVVCDNNSSDATGHIAREAGAKVVFEPVNQIARARNTGAAAATGDWLLFIDADSHPSRELFGDVAEQVERDRVLAGGSTVALIGDHPLARRGTRVWNFLSRTFTLLAGSFIFCQAGAFREVGGFSQELFAGEELELTQRLKALAGRKGKKLIILKAHPLVTSDRKVHLYSWREYLVFCAKVVLRRRTLRSREECYTWYDGKR